MAVTGQDRGKVQILQMAGAPDYCRRDDTGGGSFSDLDVQVAKLPIVTAENQDMLIDANDILYFGSATAWFGFGLCLNTFGDYGALTWQYYNDTDSDIGMGTPGWLTFVPRYDSTEGFEAHGVVVWGILENFGASTVNAQSAFWVRVSAASVTTGAKFYNLLRNTAIHEPFKLETRTLDGGLHDDIQGDTQKTDITDFDKRGFLTLSDIDVMSVSQEGIHQLKKWQRDRTKLWIVDLARTDPVDFEKDVFIRNYVGYCISVDGAIESPYKESFPYGLQFKFEDIVTSTSAIVGETFAKQEGDDPYEWTRDTVGADSTSDGGDNFNTG